MGNGMNKILPGLYVGSFRDAKDQTQLNDNRITHILAIHDNAKPLIKGVRYLCICANDNSEQDLLQYFPQCNDFIHDARVNGGAVLVHCLAGVSRSVTVTVAYIMTVTGLEWRDALNAVRGARRAANPNFGFQRQLVAFQHEHVHLERARFRNRVLPSKDEDKAELKRLIEVHRQWVLNGDNPDEEKTYPLPHNAYGKRVKSGDKVATEGSSKQDLTGLDQNEGAKEDRSKPDLTGPNWTAGKAAEIMSKLDLTGLNRTEGAKEDGSKPDLTGPNWTAGKAAEGMSKPDLTGLNRTEGAKEDGSKPDLTGSNWSESEANSSGMTTASKQMKEMSLEKSPEHNAFNGEVGEAEDLVDEMFLKEGRTRRGRSDGRPEGVKSE